MKLAFAPPKILEQPYQGSQAYVSEIVSYVNDHHESLFQTRDQKAHYQTRFMFLGDQVQSKQ